MTGYDLDRTLDDDRGSVWHATQSQIYTELRRLEAEDLAYSTDLPQTGKPDKRLYKITTNGRRALRAFLLTPVELAPSRDPLHLRLMNLGLWDGAEGLQVIANSRAALSERLEIVLHHREELAKAGCTVDSSPDNYLGFVLSIEVAISSIEHFMNQLDWVAEQLGKQHNSRPASRQSTRTSGRRTR